MSHKQSWFKIRGKPQTIFCISGIHGYLEIRHLFWVLTQDISRVSKGNVSKISCWTCEIHFILPSIHMWIVLLPHKHGAVNAFHDNWHMCDYQFYYGENISNKLSFFILQMMYDIVQMMYDVQQLYSYTFCYFRMLLLED